MATKLLSFPKQSLPADQVEKGQRRALDLTALKLSEFPRIVPLEMVDPAELLIPVEPQ